MACKIKDTLTPEGKKFMKKLKELAELEVRVGFQRDQKKAKNGADMVDVAAWYELGTSGGIPARPFLRNSVDLHQEAIERHVKSSVRSIAKGASAKDVLNGIGVLQKGLIQAEITHGDYKENTDAVKERKRKKGREEPRPLIDTTLMRRSVNYQIVKRGSMDE